MSGAETGLHVEGLSVSIGRAPILRDVGFSVAPGEVRGIIGESGSGKTMSAYAVMGLLPRAARMEGRVTLGGQDIGGMSERDMCALRGQQIGMIFQEPMTALNPVMTIGAQVAETVRIHGAGSRRAAMARAAEVLERVGLPPDEVPLSRYPHELSGGQRQRVVIASAIALRPALLIADEPTTALDVTTQAQILALLARLVREDGMGLMLISHDLAVVAGMADAVTIMKEGRVVDSGPTEALFRARRHPYTQALFAASTHVPDPVPQPPEPPPLLQLRNVERSYVQRSGLFGRPTQIRAVRGVSFDLAAGESLGLVGESGCGKSTLGRAILGLDPVDGGEIRLAGAPVHAGPTMPPEQRRRMQVVFQDPFGSFNPRHRVRRILSEPYHALDDPPGPQARATAISDALSDVGLDAADADRFIHEFSGGQRQRIAIARALIIRPELILLDEPVSALDVSVRAQVLDLLADLRRRYGLSYLFISHDLNVVRAVTDRVMVMRKGEIVEAGPTGQVLDAPQHDYTRALIAASPRLDAPLREGSRG
ncbi:ABC transporter ATP-binding protein [Oceanomicrobium pacificus]|uniref:Dipeptide ABC transporter ATP-binding protein n=1 Tax=Oceanomicrobium pacificus TaxID=2692916 RepID=A0A6B0TUL6_9RHOB|nr:ABC transporter ATP-binding protein [Oceanomicrobium pacificus]MXU66489.1 dipeptide ABC transporter ATP-binding protein [Oceanomicrobium pacificus]